jgi:predicted amidohydrolase
MAGDTYPRFRAAAAQAAPVFLDREATISRLAEWVAKARDAGADLVVFGESFVPAFPLWNMLYAPVEQHGFYRRLFENAVEIPGPQVQQLGAMARRHGVVLSVGVTEKGPVSMGAMWNTNLIFDADGRLLNRHRKLVPTWAEKLSWSNGDASNLRVERTAVGRLGALICGENTNTLARFALLAQGEQVHIATYPPAWPTRRGANIGYNLTEAIRIRSAAHAFEGKVFNVVASCALDERTIEEVSQGNSEVRDILNSAPPAASMILGPQGEPLTEPQVGGEGVVVADLDVALSIEQKQFHDIVGYYNRFDIFRLVVDQRPQSPISVVRSAHEAEETADDRSSFGESTTTVRAEKDQDQAKWRPRATS